MDWDDGNSIIEFGYDELEWTAIASSEVIFNGMYPYGKGCGNGWYMF